jgi:hypothetical protein
MVRKLKKEVKGVENLEALEQEAETEIKKYNDIRKQEFKDEMNAGYFFSVVFDSNRERDQWLKERNLSLEEEFFIRAKNFKV